LTKNKDFSMCLNTITKRYDPPDPTEKEGYKVGMIVDGMFVTEYDNRYYEFNKWYEASPSKSTRLSGVVQDGILNGGDTKYPVGFHILPTIEDAQNYKNWIGTPCSIKDSIDRYYHPTKAVKVKYKNAVAEGIKSQKVVVAQQIMFLEEVL